MYRAGGFSGTIPLAHSPAEQAVQAHSSGDKVGRLNLSTGAVCAVGGKRAGA